MKILLVSKTQIINKIFALIASKLNFDLRIQDHLKIETSYDFIIIDEDFIDDSFNFLKKHTKKLGAIVSEELPFDKSRDFIIARPFLPADLEEIIKDEIQALNIEQREALYNVKNDDETDKDVFDYVESLDDDLDDYEEYDESIVTLASLNTGGVLDNKELSKINILLKDNPISSSEDLDEVDWKNLSEIIDDALNEVQDYEFDLGNDDAVHLILNQYNINELKPLFKKFNQSIIDRLSNGECIDLKLSLKA